MAEDLTIDDLRNRIDVIDEQLVRLLNVRVACAVEIGRLKKQDSVPVYQPEREREVLRRVHEAGIALAGPLNADALVRIFERVIDEGRRAERRSATGADEENQK